MDLEWRDLLVRLDDVDLSHLLTAWRWLVPSVAEVVLVTSMGDMFLGAPDGTIDFLDTVDGRISRVSDSYAMLKERMIVPENYVRWFLPDTVGKFKLAGIVAGPGQCYSPYVAPAIGGQVAPENYHVVDLAVHFAVMGALHLAISQLPPGTPISGIELKWE